MKNNKLKRLADLKSLSLMRSFWVLVSHRTTRAVFSYSSRGSRGKFLNDFDSMMDDLLSSDLKLTQLDGMIAVKLHKHHQQRQAADPNM